MLSDLLLQLSLSQLQKLMHDVGRWELERDLNFSLRFKSVHQLNAYLCKQKKQYALEVAK